LWGKGTPRRFFGDDYWRQPIKWNREAKRAGERRRVFCASMADVFETRADLNPWRERLWRLIEQTECLDWLLLTKRPQNAIRMTPWQHGWPANVWLGTTAENQKHAEIRIPHLLAAPASVRFISAEPLLGPLTLRAWLRGQQSAMAGERGIDWVIAGGESGHGARPTDPAWVRGIRDECRATNVAFHFKQWGHWAPFAPDGSPKRKQIRLGAGTEESSVLYAVGKTAAGRILDGRTWDELPAHSA
jgi:protein gp37